MYLIKAGNLTIYDSRDKNTYPVIKPSINESLNEAGTLTFTLLPGHPYYDQMKKMQTFVTAYRDDRELFFGRVLITDKALDGQMEVTCEGGLTFLLDSEMEKGEYNESIVAFFTRIINNHNTQVEEIKRLTIGSITAAKALDTNKKYDFSLTSYQSTKEIIESMITGRFGGYVRIVPNGSGGHQIDYIEDYGRTNTQAVLVGHNIIDKSDHLSGEEMFTVLRPIGKSQPTGTAGESTDVTIESLSQSDITIPNVVKDGKLLKLTDKIAEYGIIRRTEQFNSAETPQDLLKKAEDYITRRGTQLPATCDINLVDFYHLNPTVMDVRLGDVFSSIEGFAGQVMTVGEMSIDLENPANDSIKLKNQEEINANRLDYNVEGAKKGTSSSSGLTSSSAKSSSQEQFRYKYYSERQDMALIHAKEVEINAENRFSALSSNIMLTVQEDPDKPGSGQFVLQARRHVDDPNGSILEMNVAGFKLQKTLDHETDTGATLTIDGYSIASVVQKTGINDLGQNETLHSKITQTESDITTEVSRATNAEGVLTENVSIIKQTANRVSVEVANARGDSATLAAKLAVTDEAISSEVTNRQNADSALSSQITQNANAIELRVEKDGVISAIRQSSESVQIQASKIDLQGYVTAAEFEAEQGRFNRLVSGTTTADFLSAKTLQATESFFFKGDAARWGTISLGSIASATVMMHSIENKDFDHYHTVTFSDGKFTLGKATDTAPGPFDVTATTWYSNQIVAAKNSIGFKSESLWESGSKTITLDNDKTKTISIPDPTNYSYANTHGTYYSVSFNVGGKQFTYSDIDASAVYNSVTVDSIVKNGTATYSDNYKTVYIPVTATAKNGKTLTDTISCDVSKAYEEGQKAGGDSNYEHVTITLQGEQVSVTPIQATSAIRIDSTAKQFYKAGTTTKYDRGTRSKARLVFSYGGTAYYEAGDAIACYTSSESVTRYKAGTPTEYYYGNGAAYVPQGNPSIKLKEYGYEQFYRLGSSGNYFPVGEQRRWFYGSSDGTQHYYAGSGLIYDRGTSVTVTPVGEQETFQIVSGSSQSIRPIKLTSVIRVGAEEYLYNGDGGEFTVQGSAVTAYEKKTSGGTIYYQANPATTYYQEGTTDSTTYYQKKT